MASLGAIRRFDGANWHTVSHAIVVVQNATALTGLEADAEAGQAVWVVAEKALYLFDSVTGKHVQSSGGGAPVVVEPPALAFDPARDYMEGELAWDANDKLYRANRDVAASALTPVLDPTTWDEVSSTADLGTLFSDGTEPAAWDATVAYTEDRMVLHNGTFWIARRATAAGEEPSVDAKWRSLSLDDIWRLARGTTANVAEWDATETYLEGDLVYDGHETYRAAQDVAANRDHPSFNPIDWKPIGMVPEEFQPNLVFTSTASGVPAWRAPQASMSGFITDTPSGPHDVNWDTLAALTGYDDRRAELLGNYDTNSGFRLAAAGLWGYSAGMLAIATVNKGGTDNSQYFRKTHLGSVFRLIDNLDATKYSTFEAQGHSNHLVPHTGGDLYMMKVIHLNDGPGGAPAVGTECELHLDLNPQMLDPGTSRIVLTAGTIPANVPGIGGMDIAQGTIVKMVDSNNDGLVDTYEIAAPGAHSIYRLLSTDPLPLSAVIGDLYLDTDTNAIGTLIADPAGIEPAIRGPVLDEAEIREWIAQGSLFEGTVGAVGTTLPGTLGYDTIPAAAAANKGGYYVVTEAFTTVGAGTDRTAANFPGAPGAAVPANLIVLKADPTSGDAAKAGVAAFAAGDYVTLGDGSKAFWDGSAWVATVTNAGPLPAGIDAHVGDWLMSTGDPTLGQGGYNVITGGVVTTPMADARYVKRLDVELLVPDAPIDDLVLTSVKGAEAVWKRPNSVLAGVISSAHTGSNEITWAEIGNQASYNPATVPLGVSGWELQADAANWSAAVSAITVTGRVALIPTANEIAITEYDEDGQLGGGAEFPESSLNVGHTIIRVQSTPTAFTDYLIVSILGRANNNGIQVLHYGVQKIGEGTGGPAVQGTVHIGADLTPASIMDSLVPDTYLFVGEAASPIAQGIPGIGGQSASVGDLVKVLDNDGDGNADSFFLVRGGAASGGDVERDAYAAASNFTEHEITFDFSNFSVYRVTFSLLGSARISSDKAIIIRGVQTSALAGYAKYAIDVAANVNTQFAPSGPTHGEFIIRKLPQESKLSFTQDMGAGEFVTVDAQLNITGAQPATLKLSQTAAWGSVLVEKVRL